MIDCETKLSRNVTISEAMLKRYREKFDAFLGSLRHYCAGHGFGYTISRTNTPFDELVLHMMREAASIVKRMTAFALVEVSVFRRR